jgi:anaerobic ribonucleoside-triphosphate reductase activating protein
MKPYLAAADGLTVSGGEPFDQPEALLELLRRVKTLDVDDVLVYSGYAAREIAERYPEFFAGQDKLITAFVDGPFEEENTTDSIWKGSGNQAFHLFNNKFAARYEAWTQGRARKLQWVKDKDRRFLVGIPRQEDVLRLKNLSPRLTGGRF